MQSHTALCPQCAPVPMGWPAQLGVSAATSNAWGAAASRMTPVPALPAATSTSRAPATRPALQAPTSMSRGAVSQPSSVPACALCPASPPPLVSTRAVAWLSALQASPVMAVGEWRAGGGHPESIKKVHSGPGLMPHPLLAPASIFCHKCEGLCPKECKVGTKTIDSVQVAQDLVGCTHVEGSLILNLRQGCQYLPRGHTSLRTPPFLPAKALTEAQLKHHFPLPWVQG